MSDVPVAEAMEQAQAVLDAEQPTAVEITEDNQLGAACFPHVYEARTESATGGPEQVELFPPPPAPPFDFEKAYEELARLDQRARNKKNAWEACKRDTKEAREEYDESLEDLHTAFTKVDVARRNALRQQQAMQPVLVPVVADAAPDTTEEEGEPTTEGGDEQTMSDLEQTIDDPQEPEEDEEPEPDSGGPETTTDAPGD